MMRFVSSASKRFCLMSCGFFVLLALIAAMFDSEPLIAFIAVMMLSLIILVPVCLFLFSRLAKVKKMLKLQEEEHHEVGSALLDEITVINRHIGTSGNWIFNNAIGAQCILHRHSIHSIRENDKGLEFHTSLHKKPFQFVLSKGKSGEFEKECILQWYDPLYEIPLEEDLQIEHSQSRKRTVLIAAGAAFVLAIGAVFMFEGTSIPEPGINEEIIYFYDYLTDTSTGSLDEISYEIAKDRDEYLLYIFNEGETYADLELDLYNSQDQLVDTVWSGIIRPGHYASVYLEEEPAEVRAVSSRFYTFDYHVPAIDYEVEYAWRQYNTWVNVFLTPEQLTLDNVRDVGIREYAIEDLAYTGADCVYVYDLASAEKVLDKITNQQAWDTASAKYRIDYEMYDYRIHIYELDGTKETLIETVVISEEGMKQ